MSACQVCHQDDATVHLTQVRDDQVVTLHLCGRCATEHGVTPVLPGEFAALGAMLSLLGPEAAGTGEFGPCPGCTATFAELRATGRLGCPECWSAFAVPLRELLRRVHGASQHTGAWYDDPAAGEAPSPAWTAHERMRLNQALHAAVRAEEFESAAALRDQLRTLDPS